MDLKDKVAVIIGGAGGIGQATARMMAELGAHVVITHRPNAERAAAAHEFLKTLRGSNHLALPADVAKTDTLIALRDQVKAHYGSCAILVNTAGYTKPIPHGDLDALTDELIDDMFVVNCRGQYAAVRAFAPLLKDSGDGLIVSVSSIAALNGNGSSIVYGATKAAVDVMTKSLARVLAPQVRVMAVSPGVVDTGFVPGRGAEFNAKTAATTPLKRVATPDDVARAIVACATHLTYSTGSLIIVDGGRAL